MSTKALRILVRFDFPSQTLRAWDGAGPMLDEDGNIWAGVGLFRNLDQVEMAINGEAYTLALSLNGVEPRIADLAYADYQSGDVIGSTVTIMVQPMDAMMQPSGDPEVRFTGRIDDIIFGDRVEGDTALSDITIEIVNRFTLRQLVSGSVLSETDQMARAAILNPEAPPDRFADRVATLLDKTLNWPDWS
jgi:hypothetical protein